MWLTEAIKKLSVVWKLSHRCSELGEIVVSSEEWAEKQYDNKKAAYTGVW